MKVIPLLLLLILSACSYEVVRVKHPVPENRKDLSGFNADLIGEYKVTDSIIDRTFFDAANELYNPEISLPTDSAIFLTAQMEVVISEQAIVEKTVFTVYMFRSQFDTEDLKPENRIDTIIYLNDTVKIIGNEEVDTLFNIENHDLLRKFKGHFLLNNWRDGEYTFRLLSKTKHGIWTLKDLDQERLVDYYHTFDHKNAEAKADLVYSDEPVNLKNLDLRKLIKRDYFSLRQSLKKK